MPQAPDDLRAKWTCESALAHLKKDGRFLEDGGILRPAMGVTLTQDDKDAIDYLWLEWDFGYDPTPLPQALKFTEHDVSGPLDTRRERYQEALAIVTSLAKAFPDNAAKIPNVNHFFHACWSDMVGTQGYDKQEWMDLVKKLNSLGAKV